MERRYFSIMLLQETLSKNPQPIKIDKNYNSIVQIGKRGLATYFNKNIKLIKKINNHKKKKRILIGKFCFKNLEFYIINIHAPNRNSKGFENFFIILIDIIKELKKFNIGIILGGDFNCSSNTINSSKNFKKLKLLFNNCTKELKTRKDRSLDHILTSKINCKNFYVCNNLINSDHSLIACKINIEFKTRITSDKRIIIENFDVSKLSDFNAFNYREKIFKCCTFKFVNTDKKIFFIELFNIRKEIKKIQNIKKKNKKILEKLKNIKLEWKNIHSKIQKNQFQKLKEISKKKPYIFLSEKKEIKNYLTTEELESICKCKTKCSLIGLAVIIILKKIKILKSL